MQNSPMLKACVCISKKLLHLIDLMEAQPQQESCQLKRSKGCTTLLRWKPNRAWQEMLVVPSQLCLKHGTGKTGRLRKEDLKASGQKTQSNMSWKWKIAQQKKWKANGRKQESVPVTKNSANNRRKKGFSGLKRNSHWLWFDEALFSEELQICVIQRVNARAFNLCFSSEIYKMQRRSS